MKVEGDGGREKQVRGAGREMVGQSRAIKKRIIGEKVKDQVGAGADEMQL